MDTVNTDIGTEVLGYKIQKSKDGCQIHMMRGTMKTAGKGTLNENE